MTDADPLLQVVCEHPAEDAPRLVYADWLEEHGRPERAAFIRVQCERARLPADDPRQDGLRERDLALRYQHSDGWRKELPRLRGVNWQRFWRGFVSGADFAEWRFFCVGADVAFSTAPLQFLRFNQLYPEQCRALANSSYLGRLLGLDLRGTSVGGEGVRALALCPALAGLQSLALSGVSGPDHRGIWVRHAIGEAAPQALAESPHLKSLTRLDLTFTWLSRQSLGLLRDRFGDALIYSPPT